MATILLSIKPEYVERIFNGSKKYEFRKHLPQEKVDKIVIYSTDPVQRIVGEVEVLGTIMMKPTPLWEFTKTHAGISRAKYRLYFKGNEEEKAAFVEVSIFGSASKTALNSLTVEICDIFHEELGIPKDKIYVKYSETENWGWNGSNF